MTDEDKKQFRLAAIRAAQTDIHEAVNELRNKRPGLSFQSAWNMLEKTKPKLFEALDKASDELSKIEQGTQYKQAFPPNPPTTAPDNVPPSMRPVERRTPTPAKTRDERVQRTVSVVKGGFATRLW